MFTCKVENHNGEILELTNHESEYQVVSVEGTNPPSAIVNLSKIAMIDGSKFNSSQLNVRNIVISIRLNGSVESNRIRLYSFFRSKEWCKIYYSNDSRKVTIEGYVESIEFTPFSKSEIIQISIVCPNPYFRDAQTLINDFKKVLENFEFPFAIEEEGIPFSTIENQTSLLITNLSERETGLIIRCKFNNSCNSILIRKLNTGETMTISRSFEAYDELVINTNKGSKSITLIRNAVKINAFPSMVSGSKFFELDLGENSFDYSVDSGTHNDRVEIQFEYNFVYGGV